MLRAEVSQHTEPASAASLSVDGSGCCESTSNMFSSRGLPRARWAGPARDVAANEGSVAMGETESDASASPVPALPAAGGGSDEPFACLTPAELQERARLMFVIGSSGPAKSGKGSAMPYPTKELVTRSWAVICEVSGTIGKQLSSTFGNFDKLVGGWAVRLC